MSSLNKDKSSKSKEEIQLVKRFTYGEKGVEKPT